MNNYTEIKHNEETEQILNALYKKAPNKIILPNGCIEEIPASGNLGLLSLGFEGLFALRKKREEQYGKKILFPLTNYKKEHNKNISNNFFQVKNIYIK